MTINIEKEPVEGTPTDTNTEFDASDNSNASDKAPTNMTTDYKDGNPGNVIMTVALGAKPDFRQVRLTLNTTNGAVSDDDLDKAVKFVNAMSKGFVLEVFQQTLRHKDAHNPKTKGRDIIDKKKLYLAWEAYRNDESNQYLEASISVPYVDATLSDEDILAAATAFQASLAFGGVSQDGIATIIPPTSVQKYPMR